MKEKYHTITAIRVLALLALECYEAMRLLARGLRHEEPAPAAL